MKQLASLKERLLPYSFRAVLARSDGRWYHMATLERAVGVNHNWPRS